jgi:hypothetical protein
MHEDAHEHRVLDHIGEIAGGERRGDNSSAQVTELTELIRPAIAGGITL